MLLSYYIDSDSMYRLLAFGSKHGRCNRVFFHASFHKFTLAGADTGNMYLFHVHLANATVIAVITCCNSKFFCVVVITITDYTVSGKLTMIVIATKNVIYYNRL